MENKNGKTIYEGYYDTGFKGSARVLTYTDSAGRHDLDNGHGWMTVRKIRKVHKNIKSIEVEDYVKITTDTRPTQSQSSSQKRQTNIAISAQVGKYGGSFSSQNSVESAFSSAMSSEHKGSYEKRTKKKIEFFEGGEYVEDLYVITFQHHCHHHLNGKPAGQEVLHYTVTIKDSLVQ
mmetsp:Transcript_28308/g.52880  ORF Transcript_28308/g.52880 Transcript_28308/m.52880 type:complete len:177 (-) Transcript_28308:315-845(-)